MVLMGMGSEKRRRMEATAAACARVLVDGGADVVATVCIGSPDQMLPTAVEIQEAVDVPGAMAKALGIQRESSRQPTHSTTISPASSERRPICLISSAPVVLSPNSSVMYSTSNTLPAGTGTGPAAKLTWTSM